VNNQHLLKGLFLIAIALVFGVTSLGYSMGGFGRAGPGLFPLLVSSLVFLLGAAIVVRSLVSEPVALHFSSKNIAIIVGSLCAFALVSNYVNMIAGIAALVFCSTLAGTSYSVTRNLKIAAGLIAVALIFQKLLGLQLPLY
jgi:hypothetical protein